MNRKCFKTLSQISKNPGISLNRKVRRHSWGSGGPGKEGWHDRGVFVHKVKTVLARMEDTFEG